MSDLTDEELDRLDKKLTAALDPTTVYALIRMARSVKERLQKCEVGKPFSSRSSDLSHSQQIEHLNDVCKKARVTFSCECGFKMEGPFNPEKWPCPNCKRSDLKPDLIIERDELTKRVGELEKENAWLKECESVVKEVLVNTFTSAIFGLADAAIIKQRQYDFRDVAAAVTQLGEYAKELESQLATLRAEREGWKERCAKICDEIERKQDNDNGLANTGGASECATAIRAIHEGEGKTQ